MANGKSKGNGFEREISKKLSLWWSDGDDDALFWRTQNSGGRYTVRKKVGLQTDGQAGDIASTSPLSKPFTDAFVVELKAYKDINLWSIFTDAKGTLVDWWKKLRPEAVNDGKIPLLIVKENFKPILLFTNYEFLLAANSIGEHAPCNRISIDDSHMYGTVVYLLDHFLLMKPDQVMRIYDASVKHNDECKAIREEHDRRFNEGVNNGIK